MAAKTNTSGTRKTAAAKGTGYKYLAPADPAMMRMSKVELVAHGQKGAKQAEAAGLELLRRATNAQARKAA